VTLAQISIGAGTPDCRAQSKIYNDFFLGHPQQEMKHEPYAVPR